MRNEALAAVMALMLAGCSMAPGPASETQSTATVTVTSERTVTESPSSVDTEARAVEVVRKACDLWPDVAPYIRYWRTDPQREPSPDATGPEALIVGADPDEAVIEAAYAAALDPRWSGLAERVQRAATFVNRAVSEPDSWTGPYIPDAVWADLGYITGQCRAAEDISGG